ncbi:MAG TPA: M48 family metallopeptidase [Bryobacteraceae bacterium]|nr:M48 family metallopeptidase [Bryobacteraceae bacterium]
MIPRIRNGILGLLVATALARVPLQAQKAPAQATPPAAAQQQATPQYSLPPDKLQKAIEYAQARNWLHFAGALWGVLVLVVILALGLGARFRDWAEAASKRRFVQALIFVPLVVLANDILNLPLGIYGQHLDLAFEQSIQSWPSWLWDWTKSELLAIALSVLLAFLLYGVIRRSPRRWWFYFWLAALPILFVVMFLEPILIEPLFFKFDPLAARHPALVEQLEKVVARGGLAIPPDRMFEMQASEKTNSLNAYVTGFGASKRVVVWDTTIRRLTTPETLFVFGHEMGHYVLGHVRNTLIFLALLVLVLLFLGYHLLHWELRRWGPRWRVRDIADWASLPALALIFTIFSFLTEPLINAYSRQQEHQADVYGLEVIHGIVPDSRAVASHSFQVLGEVDLDEPNPNPFIEFWLYSHASISERIAFTNSYDPWSEGTPKYVR